MLVSWSHELSQNISTLHHGADRETKNVGQVPTEISNLPSLSGFFLDDFCVNVFGWPLLKEGETKINEFPKISPGHHFGQNSPVNVVEFLFRSALPSTENPTFQNPRRLREDGAFQAPTAAHSVAGSLCCMLFNLRTYKSSK